MSRWVFLSILMFSVLGQAEGKAVGGKVKFTCASWIKAQNNANSSAIDGHVYGYLLGVKRAMPDAGLDDSETIELVAENIKNRCASSPQKNVDQVMTEFIEELVVLNDGNESAAE